MSTHQDTNMPAGTPHASSIQQEDADNTQVQHATREYFYSASDNAFYISDELSLYVAAGSLPRDLKPVTEQTFTEFALALPPEGKTRAVDPHGLPTWVDEPPLQDEVKIARNTEKRDSLLRIAAERIAPLQDAVDLDLATVEEAARLLAWKSYRIALNRLDSQEGYPLLVDWPEQPA